MCIMHVCQCVFRYSEYRLGDPRKVFESPRFALGSVNKKVWIGDSGIQRLIQGGGGNISEPINRYEWSIQNDCLFILRIILFQKRKLKKTFILCFKGVTTSFHSTRFFGYQRLYGCELFDLKFNPIEINFSESDKNFLFLLDAFQLTRY